MTIIRVSPSGPELVYSISDIGKVLTVEPDGTVKPKAVSLPSFLVENPIPRNSGTATIATQVGGIPALPLDVAPNSLVSLAVDVQFSVGAGLKVWIGSLLATATRVGNGAVTITSQAMGSPVELTDLNWSPEFIVQGSQIALQINSDAVGDIVPRGTFTATISNMANDPPIPTLAEIRAVLFSESFAQLYYADVGTTPVAPVDGEEITAMADQSGLARHQTWGAGHRPTFNAVDVALNETTALEVAGVVAAVGPMATGSHTILWTMGIAIAAGTMETLLARAGELVLIHTSGVYGNGDKIALVDSTARAFVPSMPTGKHDYAISVDNVANTATLFIDKISMSTIAIDAVTATAAITLGVATGLFANCTMNGYAVIDGVATDELLNNWELQSLLAWGPNA
jgi:hypothetical protein